MLNVYLLILCEFTLGKLHFSEEYLGISICSTKYQNISRLRPCCTFSIRLGCFVALRLVIVTLYDILSDIMTSSLPALLELLFDVFKIPFLPMLFVREGSNIFARVSFPNYTKTFYNVCMVIMVSSWSMVFFHDLYLQKLIELCLNLLKHLTLYSSSFI